MTQAATCAEPLPLALPARANVALWGATLLVGAVFFATEHDPRVSLADSYTSTLDEMEVASTGGNTIRRVAFLALGAFGAWCLATSNPRSTQGAAWAPKAAPWVLFAFYLAWCALSVVWSEEPGMTVRRVLVLGCYCLGAAGLARRFTGAELMRLCVAIALVLLAFGLCAELALGTFKPWKGDYRFAGSQHPNTTALGIAAMCIAAFCWWRGGPANAAVPNARTSPRDDTSAHRALHATPWLLRGFFVVAFGFLILTKSRTSAAGVLASLLFLWTLSTPLRIKAGFVLSGVWLVGVVSIIILLAGMSVEDDLSRVALLGREEQSESLTGRLPIWTELAPFVGRRLFVGYGYDSFWTADHIDDVSREVQWPVREAHSAYIELALSVGILAGAVLIAAIVMVMRRRAHWYLATQSPEHGFFLGLQLYCLINGLTESAVAMPLFVPFILACGLAQGAAESGAGTGGER